MMSGTPTCISSEILDSCVTASAGLKLTRSGLTGMVGYVYAQNQDHTAK